MALKTTKVMLFPVLAQAILNNRLSISENVAKMATNAYANGSSNLCTTDTSISDLSNHPSSLMRRRHVRRLNHISINLELPEECLFSLGRHISTPTPLSREPSTTHPFVAPLPLDKATGNAHMFPQSCRKRASSLSLDDRIQQTFIDTVEHVAPNNTQCTKCNSTNRSHLHNSTCSIGMETNSGLLTNRRASLQQPPLAINNNNNSNALTNAESLHGPLERRLSSRRLSHSSSPNKNIANRVTILRRYSIVSTHSMTIDIIADSYRGTSSLSRVSNGNANNGMMTMMMNRRGSLASMYGMHLPAETPLSPGFRLAYSPLSSAFYKSFIADLPSPKVPLLPVSSADSAISSETNPITPRTEFFTNIIQSMTGEEEFAIRAGSIAMAQRHDLAARRKRC